MSPGKLCDDVRARFLDLGHSISGAIALGDPDVLSAQLLAQGEDVDDVAALELEVRALQAKAGPGLVLFDAFSRAAQGTPDDDAVRESELVRSPEPTPRFASTLETLDDPERGPGGFYGFVILGGAAGVGKSALALASAVRFAREGGKVVYINCEMGRAQLSLRIQRACGGWVHELVGKGKPFRILDVSGAKSLAPIFERCSEMVSERDPRVLVVIDTMNTLAREIEVSSKGEAYYWTTLSELLSWCLAIRRRTDGLASFILISELTRKGETKGAPDPLADLVLNLTPGSGPDSVVIACTKGREGGRGPLGTYLVDWRAGRLKRAE